MDHRKKSKMKEYYSEKWKSGGYNEPKIIGGIDIRRVFDEERKKRALSFLSLRKGDVVLDAGCGNGKFTLKVGEKCKKIYGIDLTKESFKFSQTKKQSNVVFREEDMCSLRFENSFFDKIVCIEALEHVLKPEKALSEFYRTLKPEGYLVLTYPLFNKTVVRQIEFFLKLRKIKPIEEHITEWSFDELVKILTKKGFEIIRYEGIAFDFGKLLGKFMEKSSHISKIILNKGLGLKKYPRNSFFVVLVARKL